MKVLVDTSVWSLALCRRKPSPAPEAALLAKIIAGEGEVFVTGLIVQEILRSASGIETFNRLERLLRPFPCLQPEREDHVAAAHYGNRCRDKGVQLGTIDALLAALAIRHDLYLLSTDKDFHHAARFIPLQILKAPQS